MSSFPAITQRVNSSPLFFIRPKKDNRVRVILNPKFFNVSVENVHFKMETLKHALTLVSSNCFFCSLVLRDAYYSVHMTEKSQNFLKFEWKGQLYKYTDFPNGKWSGLLPKVVYQTA